MLLASLSLQTTFFVFLVKQNLLLNVNQLIPINPLQKLLKLIYFIMFFSEFLELANRIEDYLKTQICFVIWIIFC